MANDVDPDSAKNAEIMLEDFAANELIKVYADPSAMVEYGPCRFAPDGKNFAIGTDYYWGVGGKEGDPGSGHVLLFKPKGP